MTDIQKRIEETNKNITKILSRLWKNLYGKEEPKFPIDDRSMAFIKAEKDLHQQILELIKDYGEILIPKKYREGEEHKGWNTGKYGEAVEYYGKGWNACLDQMRAKFNGDIK